MADENTTPTPEARAEPAAKGRAAVQTKACRLCATETPVSTRECPSCGFTYPDA